MNKICVLDTFDPGDAWPVGNHEKWRDRDDDSGFGDMLVDFVLVSGQLDVHELNWAIACTGYRPTFLDGF